MITPKDLHKNYLGPGKISSKKTSSSSRSITGRRGRKSIRSLPTIKKSAGK